MNQSYSPLRVPVFTTTERYLGRVVDVELNFHGDQVVYFRVRPPFSISRLWQKILLIHARQVVSFNTERIVVRDTDTKIPVEVRVGLTSELPVG